MILGRFYEGHSYQELSSRCGATPDAVRMKLTRILEKLSGMLKRRGVAVPIAVLASGLSAQWSQTAPAGLGAAITAAAGAETAAASSPPASIFTIMTSAKSAALTFGVAVLGLTSLSLQSARIEHLKANPLPPPNHENATAQAASAPAPMPWTGEDDYDIYGKPLPDTRPVTPSILLAQIRSAVEGRAADGSDLHQRQQSVGENGCRPVAGAACGD